MYNYIEEHWRPEYEYDSILRSLRYQTKRVLESYEKLWKRYSETEEGTRAAKEAERDMEQKSRGYNEKLQELAGKFDARVEELYG